MNNSTKRAADALNKYWAERGYDAQARVVLEGTDGRQKIYAVKSNLRNGIPTKRMKAVKAADEPMVPRQGETMAAFEKRCGHRARVPLSSKENAGNSEAKAREMTDIHKQILAQMDDSLQRAFGIADRAGLDRKRVANHLMHLATVGAVERVQKKQNEAVYWRKVA